MKHFFNEPVAIFVDEATWPARMFVGNSFVARPHVLAILKKVANEGETPFRTAHRLATEAARDLATHQHHKTLYPDSQRALMEAFGFVFGSIYRVALHEWIHTRGLPRFDPNFSTVGMPVVRLTPVGLERALSARYEPKWRIADASALNLQYYGEPLPFE